MSRQSSSPLKKRNDHTCPFPLTQSEDIDPMHLSEIKPTNQHCKWFDQFRSKRLGTLQFSKSKARTRSVVHSGCKSPSALGDCSAERRSRHCP